MAGNRATFFFKDGEFSWTETYYGSVSGEDVPAFLKRAIILGTARTKCLPSKTVSALDGPELDEIRVSADDTFRDSLIDTSCRRGGKNAGYDGKMNGTDDPLMAPNRPYSVLLLRCESGRLYRKSIYMGGVPDAVLIDPPGPNLTDSAGRFVANFDSFKAILLPLAADKKVPAPGPSGWGFKALSNEDGDAPAKGVTAVTIGEGGKTAVVTIPGHSFVRVADWNHPLRVRIRGVKTANKKNMINGTWDMKVVAEDTIVIYPKAGKVFTDQGYIDGTGIARQSAYQIFPFTAIIPKGETHRKRGVRSGRPLGRSKSRS